MVFLASWVHPGGKIAKTDDALPLVARKAVRSNPASYPKTALWALRS